MEILNNYKESFFIAVGIDSDEYKALKQHKPIIIDNDGEKMKVIGLGWEEMGSCVLVDVISEEDLNKIKQKEKKAKADKEMISLFHGMSESMQVAIHQIMEAAQGKKEGPDNERKRFL